MAFSVELMFHPHVEMHIFELRSLSVLKRSTFLANGSWKEKELNAIRFNRHFPSLVIRDQRHIVQSKIFHQGWFISGMRFCWEANGQKGAGDTQCCSVPQTCGSGEGSSVKVNCDTAVSSNQWKQCGRTLELGIVGPLWSARSVCFVFLVSTLSFAHLNNALKAGILEKIFLATFTDLLTTQSQLVWSFESQNWVKVKVVKGVGKSEISIIWCISITNKVKSYKITERAQTFNFSDFPLMLGGSKGPKLCKRKRFCSLVGKFSEVFRGCQTSRAFRKCGCFCC